MSHKQVSIDSHRRNIIQVFVGIIGIISAAFSGIILAISGNYLSLAIALHLTDTNKDLVYLVIFLFLSSTILYGYSLYIFILDSFSIRYFSISVSLLLIGELIISVVSKKYIALNYIGSNALFLGISIFFAWISLVSIGLLATLGWVLLGRIGMNIVILQIIISAVAIDVISKDLSPGGGVNQVISICRL
jgi:hypothetical protein